MSNDSVVIVSAARTPLGSLSGAFASMQAAELGAVATKAVVEQANLKNDEVQEVLYGCVLPAGQGQAPARQVALGADLDLATACTSISKVCGSGMKAAMMAYDQIVAGSSDVVVAGGMESMTNAPYLVPGARQGLRAGHKTIQDHMFLDGLEDAYTGKSMGSFAQVTADKYGMTRESLDAFAIESLTRAQTAIKEGYFKDEIVPVTVKSRRGEVVVDTDEQPGKGKIDAIPNLKPAFAKDGTITAANSSSISDGAASMVLMKESDAEARGLKPLVRILAHAANARHPSEYTIAPVDAIKRCVDKAGWTMDEVDLFEINEAFGMVTQLAMQELNLDHARVNVNGGACALGHPIGCTGARIIVTLIYALKRLGKQKGIASLCIGGGEATAIAIELV